MEWSFVMACRQFCHWEQDNKANGEDSSDWMRGGGACDEGGAAVALEEVVGVNVCRRLPFLGAMGRAALRDGGGGCVIVVVIIVSSSLFRSGDWGARFSILDSVVGRACGMRCLDSSIAR